MTRQPRKTIALGTRGSPLALAQAAMVKAALRQKHPDLVVETVVIRTSGDWRPEHGETPLEERKGGKALFAKEIEEALIAGTIDAGVHSMKDMETILPPGLCIAAMLPREDARDALVFADKASVRALGDLPAGSVIGTCSVRRMAFLGARRPDLRFVPLRGNVGTRLDKLRRGEQGMDAIVLACAGLRRLGLDVPHSLIDIADCLPSAGQGAVGIEIRDDRNDLLDIFGQINDFKTQLCVTAEREVLEYLEGSCRTPIGSYGILSDDGRLDLFGALAEREMLAESRVSAPVESINHSISLGKSLGEALRAKVVAT